MCAAVQALLLSGHGEKDDGGGKTMLAEHTSTLQADGGAAAVIVGAGRGIGRVVGIAVARVVVSGDEHDAAGIGRIGAAQHSINIGDCRGLGYARRRLLNELVGLYL